MLLENEAFVEIAMYNHQTVHKLASKNRIELLSVLSHSILREIEALQRDENASAEREIDLGAEVQRFEADLIRGALIKANGKQRQAARLLNVKVTTLHNKMKRYGIPAHGFNAQN